MKTKKDFDHGIPKNKFNPHAMIVGNPTIDKDTWIGPFTLIDALHANVRIGKGCNISAGSQIISHSTVKRCVSEGKHKNIDTGDVTVGDYCFIGTNAIVLMGCTIGHHSVIGAGCVVPEGTKVPNYSLVTGVPGKIVGSTKKFTKK